VDLFIESLNEKENYAKIFREKPTIFNVRVISGAGILKSNNKFKTSQRSFIQF